MPLPKDKEGLQLVSEELVDLKENPAYLRLQEQFSNLLQQAERELVGADSPIQFRRLQGQVVAYRKVINALPDLASHIKRELSSL